MDTNTLTPEYPTPGDVRVDDRFPQVGKQGGIWRVRQTARRGRTQVTSDMGAVRYLTDEQVAACLALLAANVDSGAEWVRDHYSRAARAEREANR